MPSKKYINVCILVVWSLDIPIGNEGNVFSDSLSKVPLGGEM